MLLLLIIVAAKQLFLDHCIRRVVCFVSDIVVCWGKANKKSSYWLCASAEVPQLTDKHL